MAASAVCGKRPYSDQLRDSSAPPHVSQAGMLTRLRSRQAVSESDESLRASRRGVGDCEVVVQVAEEEDEQEEEQDEEEEEEQEEVVMAPPPPGRVGGYAKKKSVFDPALGSLWHDFPRDEFHVFDMSEYFQPFVSAPTHTFADIHAEVEQRIWDVNELGRPTAWAPSRRDISYCKAMYLQREMYRDHEINEHIPETLEALHYLEYLVRPQRRSLVRKGTAPTRRDYAFVVILLTRAVNLYGHYSLFPRRGSV